MPTNQIRIIGGQWRSRLIIFADTPGLRPTPNRVRETLFNWLQYDIPGSRCLDLYAGSGALGYEAASRGAKEVIQIEQDSRTCRALQENIANLNTSQINAVQSDVLQYLSEQQASPFDIVFLDPPFNQNLVTPTCRCLEEKGWLTQNSLIYVEMESGKTLENTIPDNWQLMKSKTAGKVCYQLFKRLA
ncbi:MAG: 16S rRNA (guanine(966)-N(2))-methyltransferase RsmD [Gammaproteobacteria bacterium]|nr:16S rRNA (guanine(966)-N(2))-methyltransferase RsmD [Gammaproteobacteria bacterium]